MTNTRRACLAVFILCGLSSLLLFQTNIGRNNSIPKMKPLSFTREMREQNQQPIKKQNKVSKILLMTYMRSGSSFVGELLKFGGNVFYVYEPFWSVYEKTFRTDTEVCHRNGTCQKPSKTLQKTDKTIDIISAIFDCRISELPVEVLKSFTTFHFTSGYSRRCKSILKKRQTWKSRRKKVYDNKKEWCLSRWERACKTATARVIKTIRLSPRLLKKTDRLSDVKIVHLTRHPFGILNSRMNIGEVNSSNFLSSARHLCQMMGQDVLYVKDKVKNGKEDTVVPLTFECLASNPTDVVKNMFASLNLNYSRDTENWIAEHTNHSSRRTLNNAKEGSLQNITLGPQNTKQTNGTFHVRKTMSKEVSSTWRSSLSTDLIKDGEQVCENVLKEIAFSVYDIIFCNDFIWKCC